MYLGARGGLVGLLSGDDLLVWRVWRDGGVAVARGGGGRVACRRGGCGRGCGVGRGGGGWVGVGGDYMSSGGEGLLGGACDFLGGGYLFFIHGGMGFIFLVCLFSLFCFLYEYCMKQLNPHLKYC